MIEIAERSARDAWEEQRAAVVAPYTSFAPATSEADRELILAFLAGIGVESLLFTPIGAGPECLGNLVLTRLPGAPEWTEAEAATALDIGHDLGRAILNARTFEREHQLVEELQELDTYKGQLIATVAHELKNPLTSVMGHLEMLESSPDLTGTMVGSLNAMERGARRMVRVIDDLLLLAKVGDADNPMIAAPVDLHRVVDEVVDLTQVAAEQKSLQVRVQAPDEPVLALGDADELDRICANLVSNAVKYTPDRGVVTISVARSGDEVVLTVADEGIGISRGRRRPPRHGVLPVVQPGRGRPAGHRPRSGDRAPDGHPARRPPRDRVRARPRQHVPGDPPGRAALTRLTCGARPARSPPGSGCRCRSGRCCGCRRGRRR